MDAGTRGSGFTVVRRRPRICTKMAKFDFIHIRRDDLHKEIYMSTSARVLSLAALLAIGTSSLFAQAVVSAHSGTVHYFEGAVTIDGAAIEAKKAKFNELKDNGVLATAQGRAEVLLTPGVILRIGENSSIKMLDTRLLSTRVELLSGSAMLESDDPEVNLKDPAVTIVYKDYQLQPVKYGLFEITAEPSQLKVFKGQVEVVAADSRVVVKEGHLLPFSAALLAEKFDAKTADDLYLWTRDRSAYLSVANVSAANTASHFTSLPSTWQSYGPYRGSWYYNQYMDMFTFMPFNGTLWSPFGYGFFSPYSVGFFYNPYGYYWYGGGGSPTNGSTGQPIGRPGASTPTRFGVALNHPTPASPIRSTVNGNGFVSARGAFDRGLASSAPAPSFDAATAASSRGFSSGNAGSVSSAPSFSAPASIGHSGGGAAPGAPRGR